MALVVKDRVQETSTTTGTGTFTLAGAVSGFQSFSAIGNGNTTYYSITDGTNWEVGVGTYTSSGTTLSRDTVLESSNSDNLVDFGAGSKFVFCTYPADKSVYADASSKVSGYVIENSTIGATTASTGRFTSVTTPSVTATTTDLTLSAISTGNVNLATLGGTQFKAIEATGSVNVWNVRGGDGSTTSPRFTTEGTGTNIAGQFNTKGTGALQFFSGNTEQMRITNTASAVNYVQVTGNVTTSAPVISSQGSDTNIALSFVAKGNARHNFFNNSATSSRQFSIGTSGITSAVNFLNVDGSVSGIALPMQAQGTDTNISIAFQPKGTGAIDLAAGSSGVNISNGGTVTAITRTATGSGYTSLPSVAISAPTTAGGVQAVATPNMFVFSVTVASGGTGYTVGNILTLVGGTGAAGQVTVATVSGGVITGITNGPSNGLYSALPTTPAATTGGTGTGATINITGYGVSNFTITNAGSGYIEQPTVTFSGGGGSGAAAYATVGSGTTVKTLGSSISFNVPSSEVLRLSDGSSAACYLNLQSSSTTIQGFASSSGSNVGYQWVTKGVSNHSFATNNSVSTEQFRVSHTASAVNYVQVSGNSTANFPSITFTGSDSGVGGSFISKGTGSFSFYSNGGLTNRQVRIDGSIASVNYLDLYGNIAGSAPSVRVAGSDTNIDLALTPKGTGRVKFGTYTGTISAITGYIEILDSGGTVRRLAVVA